MEKNNELKVVAVPRNSGLGMIAAERQRQMEVEGWSAEHDATHTDDSLAKAAACYAMPSDEREKYQSFTFSEPKRFFPRWWPKSWHVQWWKPTPQNRIRELQKAGALIAAEIDRYLAMPWKIYNFSKDGRSYDVKAKTKEEAVSFLALEHDIDIKNCFEVPESAWDKKTIPCYEDNDTEKEPFFLSLREAMSSDETELLATNDRDIID
jgi:hypothetical protein